MQDAVFAFEVMLARSVKVKASDTGVFINRWDLRIIFPIEQLTDDQVFKVGVHDAGNDFVGRRKRFNQPVDYSRRPNLSLIIGFARLASPPALVTNVIHQDCFRKLLHDLSTTHPRTALKIAGLIPCVTAPSFVKINPYLARQTCGLMQRPSRLQRSSKRTDEQASGCVLSPPIRQAGGLSLSQFGKSGIFNPFVLRESVVE